MPTGHVPSWSLPALALLLGCAPHAAFSQAVEHSLAAPHRHADGSIAVRFGTLGVGLEASKLLTGHLGARAGANYFKHSATRTQSDITYDASLTLQAVTALLDFFPGQRRSFHLTGGIMTNPAKVSATGKPSTAGTFDIDGNSYTSAEVGTLREEGKFPSGAPYVGFGWGTPARKRGAFGFLLDLGAALGKAVVSLTSTGAASIPSLASDLKAQEKRTQRDIAKFAKVYPALTLGLAYRF